MLLSVLDGNQGSFLSGGAKTQHDRAQNQPDRHFVGDDGAHLAGLDPHLNLVRANGQSELPGPEQDVASDRLRPVTSGSPRPACFREGEMKSQSGRVHRYDLPGDERDREQRNRADDLGNLVGDSLIHVSCRLPVRRIFACKIAYFTLSPSFICLAG